MQKYLNYFVGNLQVNFFQLRIPINRLLINLIYAEMISAGWGLPVDFFASISHGWTLGKQMCIATGFLMTLSGKKLARKYSLER